MTTQTRHKDVKEAKEVKTIKQIAIVKTLKNTDTYEAYNERIKADMKHLRSTLIRWMSLNWLRCGMLLLAISLCLLPSIAAHESTPLLLVYVCLPAYLIHQFEEHYADRFRVFINTYLAEGLEALSREAVMWTNVVGVWLSCILSYALARWIQIGFGLIAAYLLLLNAVVHCISTLVLRRYNPGLYTALVLFFPLSAYILFLYRPTAALYHCIGLSASFAIHAAIAIHTKRRIRALSAVART